MKFNSGKNLERYMKNVNGEGNRKRAAALIEQLAEDYGVQIIMTTGYEWLRVGTLVEF